MTAKSVRENIHRAISRRVSRTSLAIWGQLMQTTPVDTGRARASWRMARDRADPSVHEEVEKGTTVAPPQTPNIGERPGRVVISNNLPYINRLNEGHSEQAPKKFIQGAVRRATRRQFRQ